MSHSAAYRDGGYAVAPVKSAVTYPRNAAEGYISLHRLAVAIKRGVLIKRICSAVFKVYRRPFAYVRDVHGDQRWTDVKCVALYVGHAVGDGNGFKRHAPVKGTRAYRFHTVGDNDRLDPFIPFKSPLSYLRHGFALVAFGDNDVACDPVIAGHGITVVHFLEHQPLRGAAHVSAALPVIIVTGGKRHGKHRRATYNGEQQTDFLLHALLLTTKDDF